MACSSAKQTSSKDKLEVTLVNYSDTDVVINRKPYDGRSNVKFSLTKKALHCMINILAEAEEKL